MRLFIFLISLTLENMGCEIKYNLSHIKNFVKMWCNLILCDNIRIKYCSVTKQ